MVLTLSFATGVTRYGAGCATPQQATAVLRAKARAQGLVLRPATPVDLVAAALTTDAWMLLTGATSLALPATYGPHGLLVLSAALHRAAGQGGPLVEQLSHDIVRTPRFAAAVDDYAQWARQQLGNDVSLALDLAASDLSLAGPDTPFAAFAQALRLGRDVES